MNLEILFEDADVVAINKPAGLVTHSDGRTEEPTAEEWFTERYGGGPVSSGQNEAGLASPERSGGGYVHRIDRDTSGVLIFAKNQNAYDFLRKAFHDRLVKKTYRAIVYGTVKTEKGSIDFDIGRSRKDFRLRSAQPKAKGKLREALTHYTVDATLPGTSGSPGLSLLTLHPETGRTHQIRVHLKAIHHPILGDSLYAPNHKSALGVKRLALHALAVDLPLPGGQTVHIEAPLPSDLAQAFAQFSHS